MGKKLEEKQKNQNEIMNKMSSTKENPAFVVAFYQAFKDKPLLKNLTDTWKGEGHLNLI